MNNNIETNINTELHLNSNLVNCYFCESFHFLETIFISEYNNVMICYECVINHTKQKPITIIDNIECSVCYNINKGIELPSCNHIVCIDCYKKIYFGFIVINENEKIIKPNPPEKREFFPKKELNEIFQDYLYPYDFSKSLSYLLEQREHLTQNREEWMNVSPFFDYETEFIIYCKKQYEIDLQDIEYYNQKVNNITNARCPLCRM
jgi:hypothetical protein